MIQFELKVEQGAGWGPEKLWACGEDCLVNSRNQTADRLPLTLAVTENTEALYAGPVFILCAVGRQEDDWRLESNAFELRSTCGYHFAVTRDLAPR